MVLKDKKLLIVGMARSGIKAALFAHKKDAVVTVYDGKSEEELKESIDLLAPKGIKIICGGTPDVEAFDLLVLSPGVPTDLPFIEKARQSDIPVIGEIELAYNFCKGKVIGITGTNGKTTTTSLVGHILSSYDPGNIVAGNIGVPFTEVVESIDEEHYAILELSSFQLESIEKFNCDIASVLNITPDHLNRHKTMENYIDAKKNIFMNQSGPNTTVLNGDDPECFKMADATPGRVMFFSYERTLFKGVYREGNDIVLLMPDHEKTVVCSIDELKVLGRHNVENVMAAIAICYLAKVPTPFIRKQILTFAGSEHRGEYVGTFDGVSYYNDSKATNPDSAIAGLSAMTSPTILIGGGMNKNNTYHEWIKGFEDKVKCFIVFGETAEQLISESKSLGFTRVKQVSSLEEAVALAKEEATEGDSVLLSPACASWDMFSSYEERGNLFKKLVLQ